MNCLTHRGHCEPGNRFVQCNEPPRRESLHVAPEISRGFLSLLACTREPVEDPGAVGIRLETADAPEAGIRKRSPRLNTGLLGHKSNAFGHEGLRPR